MQCILTVVIMEDAEGPRENHTEKRREREISTRRSGTIREVKMEVSSHVTAGSDHLNSNK